MTPTSDQLKKAYLIENGMHYSPEIDDDAERITWLALACALLTSPVKAERESGKELVRKWRRDGAEYVANNA